MSYRNDPRWLAAQERYVARTTDDETPDQAFARVVTAAYEMYLIQTGHEVPAELTAEQALVTYSLILAKRDAASAA